MTLEGAINFNDTNTYTIYTMNSATAGQYCVVLPKNNMGTYNMLVDLHMKSLFDSVNSGIKQKEDLINEISKEYNNVTTKYSDAILVIPMLDEENYINIINTNDKQKMFDEVKKIGAITSELYKKLVEGGLDKQKIDQKIIIIEKNEHDKKFVEWLKEQMPNFVSSIDINEFTVPATNPFVTDPTPVATPTDNNIFATPTTETSNPTLNVNETTNDLPQTNTEPVQEAVVNTVVEPVQAVEPVTDIPAPQPTPVVQTEQAVPNIFEEAPAPQSEVQTPAVEPAPQPNQPVVEQPQVQPTTPVQQPVAEPQPVQSVELEKTVTFSPVNENTQQPVAETPVQPVNQQPEGTTTPNTEGVVEGGEPTRKSNGFVNLAILLVIMVGVTLVSIELGKFLYNTYGV